MESKKVLKTKDLNKIGIRSIFFLNSSFNYEKMQAAGWTNSIAPALEKIYGDDKEALSKALQDHMQFINTNTNLSSFLMGLIISLEEKKEDRALINSLKTGLFAPLAGIGDAIFWFTLLPIIAGLCASLAVEGQIIGPILFFILYMIIAFGRLWFVQVGYRLGTSVITVVNKFSAQVTKSASILGVTVIGGLIATYVNLEIVSTISITDNNELSVQTEFLDKIFPGILPIALTFGLYYLVKNKKANPVILIIALILFSILESYLGVV